MTSWGSRRFKRGRRQEQPGGWVGEGLASQRDLRRPNGILARWTGSLTCKEKNERIHRRMKNGTAYWKKLGMFLWCRNGGHGRDASPNPTHGSASTGSVPSDPHHPPRREPRDRGPVNAHSTLPPTLPVPFHIFNWDPHFHLFN